MKIQSNKREIYVISDGTGETAEKLARAALLQFKEITPSFRIFTKVLTINDLEQIINKAVNEHAFIFYTLVNIEHREFIRLQTLRYTLGSADLLSSLMNKLTQHFGEEPILAPGLGHHLDEDYFKRIEAIEFAVKNDDGQESRNFFRADIVLVGLSRTSKTPLSMYLAHKGYKVANYPAVKEIMIPSELFQIEPYKVCALKIDLEELIKIRRARLSHLGLSIHSNYADRDYVSEEINWFDSILNQNSSWKSFNITNRAIEETAADIIRHYEQKKSLKMSSIIS